MAARFRTVQLSDCPVKKPVRSLRCTRCITTTMAPVIAELEAGLLPWVQPCGHGRGQGAARHAKERSSLPAVFRHQYPTPLGRRHPARLSLPALAALVELLREARMACPNMPARTLKTKLEIEQPI
jgi:hypothetical protein